MIILKKPFKPKLLPLQLAPSEIIYLYKLALEARVKIERFNALLERSVVNQSALLYFSMQESIESTKIEGTQTTFTEVIESEITGIDTNDTQEVKNYLEALRHGVNRLQQLPLTTRLFHELHTIILMRSRGQNRSPGEYRRIQNFIGPTSDNKDATYIPPEPNKIAEYISNLESYINNDIDDLDPIIKAGIIHAQFETIHPYLDGNGRLGRILVILYLLDKKVTNTASFFISQELEKNKYKYYAHLNNLRTDNPKWVEWLEFFITSAIKQADKNIIKLTAIEDLQKTMLTYAEEHSIRIELIDFIFKKPFFTIKDIQEELNVSYNTASSNVQKLLESNKIFPDDKKRNRIFRFYEILDILDH